MSSTTSAMVRASYIPCVQGRIYEETIELGVLVWQDFQFACGVYPAFDSFVKSVREEAVDNVKRLRHHPSIAIFCGNNEGMFVSHGFICSAINSWTPRLPDGSSVGR